MYAYLNIVLIIYNISRVKSIEIVKIMCSNSSFFYL